MSDKRNILFQRIKREYKQYLDDMRRHGEEVDGSDEQVADFGCYLSLKFDDNVDNPTICQ